MLIVHDANIFIDLEAGGLLRQAFKLPHKVVTADALFRRELEEQHAQLLELGLELLEVNPDGVLRSYSLEARYKSTSAMDRLCLALAEQEQCPLCTGDKNLRIAAEAEGLEVHGTLWLVEAMVRERLITKEHAISAYETMEAAGRRLPFAQAKRRIQGV